MDSMHTEQATAVLVNFQHQLLLQEKNKSFLLSSEPIKVAYHCQDLKTLFEDVENVLLDLFHYVHCYQFTSDLNRPVLKPLLPSIALV